MAQAQGSSSSIRDNDIRIWKHGEFPMPDWVPQHMSGGIEANGTFAIDTQLGRARVHLGNIVIERSGLIWVRPAEDASEFIKDLKLFPETQLTNLGPGKVHQYGAGKAGGTKSKSRMPSASEKRRRYSPPVGSQPTIEWIHLASLIVDHTYQRTTDNLASQRLIASIAAKFDWRLCAPLVVSRRVDENLAIIDGQHRWLAASLRGDIPQLPCCVFRYASMEEEARMFIIANRARKPMNRLDDYFAALKAADEDALEIKELVEDAGLTVARNTSSTSWRPGEVAFTSSIATSIRKFGPSITSAALTNIATAFSGQKLTFGGAIFGGLIKIMSKQPPLDPDRLLGALESRSADEWASAAIGLQGGDIRATALHDAILEAYYRDVCKDPDGKN